VNASDLRLTAALAGERAEFPGASPDSARLYALAIREEHRRLLEAERLLFGALEIIGKPRTIGQDDFVNSARRFLRGEWG
jgi:hypothetical protein